MPAAFGQDRWAEWLLQRRFLHASAEDLRAQADASVDVVTTRSVLIYVAAKAEALREFHRVLRPGGRLSIVEPINRLGWPQPADRLFGYDVPPSGRWPRSCAPSTSGPSPRTATPGSPSTSATCSR